MSKFLAIHTDTNMCMWSIQISFHQKQISDRGRQWQDVFSSFFSWAIFELTWCVWRSWPFNGAGFSTWSTPKLSAPVSWSLLLAIKQLKIAFIWSTGEHHSCKLHFTSYLLPEYRVASNGWSNTACGCEKFIQNFPFLPLEHSHINDTMCF